MNLERECIQFLTSLSDRLKACYKNHKNDIEMNHISNQLCPVCQDIDHVLEDLLWITRDSFTPEQVMHHRKMSAQTEAQTQTQTEAQTQTQTEAQTQAQTETQTQAQTETQTPPSTSPISSSISCHHDILFSLHEVHESLYCPHITHFPSNIITVECLPKIKQLSTIIDRIITISQDLVDNEKVCICCFFSKIYSHIMVLEEWDLNNERFSKQETPRKKLHNFLSQMVSNKLPKNYIDIDITNKIRWRDQYGSLCYFDHNDQLIENPMTDADVTIFMKNEPNCHFQPICKSIKNGHIYLKFKLICPGLSCFVTDQETMYDVTSLQWIGQAPKLT